MRAIRWGDEVVTLTEGMGLVIRKSACITGAKLEAQVHFSAWLTQHGAGGDWPEPWEVKIEDVASEWMRWKQLDKYERAVFEDDREKAYMVLDQEPKGRKRRGAFEVWIWYRE